MRSDVLVMQAFESCDVFVPEKRFQETSLEYVFRPDAMRSQDAAASKVSLDLE